MMGDFGRRSIALLAAFALALSRMARSWPVTFREALREVETRRLGGGASDLRSIAEASLVTGVNTRRLYRAVRQGTLHNWAEGRPRIYGRRQILVSLDEVRLLEQRPSKRVSASRPALLDPKANTGPQGP